MALRSDPSRLNQAATARSARSERAVLPVTWVCSVPHQHVNVTTIPLSVLASDETWLGKMSTRLAHTWQLLSNIVDLLGSVV
jgi:hypothetical protein